MEACIFDLDGTLTDTLESLQYSVNATLREMNLPEITAGQCQSFVGDGAKCLIERALKTVGDAYAERLEEGMEIYGRIFDANCTYHVTPYDGVRELLLCLREHGIRLGVLSNKPDRQAVKVVHAIFGEQLFDCIEGQKKGVAKKPDPSGIYGMLERLQADKEACLYIGDSEVDVMTGKNADVKMLAAAWGFRSREILRQAGAKHIVDTPEEILKYL